ncbi:MAG: type II toxin-antitoxin system Phd/YefM family antitoxin [Candidatus Omnitrophota bacterium]
MNTTIRQLRSETKSIIETVMKGEEVIITNRGKACAKIVPIDQDTSPTSHEEIFGLWKNRKDMDNPSEYVRGLRKGRNAG